MRKTPALKIFLPLLISSLLLSACSTQKKSSRNKIDPYRGISYNVNLKYFTSKSLQLVGAEVYGKMNNVERKKYVLQNEFTRHHTLKQMRDGRCDNTVQGKIQNTEKISFCCGGHTSSER